MEKSLQGCSELPWVPFPYFDSLPENYGKLYLNEEQIWALAHKHESGEASPGQVFLKCELAASSSFL